MPAADIFKCFLIYFNPNNSSYQLSAYSMLKELWQIMISLIYYEKLNGMTFFIQRIFYFTEKFNTSDFLKYETFSELKQNG